MADFLEYFKDKKNLMTLLILGILILAVPIGIDLIRKQKIFTSKATQDPIVFTGVNVRQVDNRWVVVDPNQPISLELTSPLGPPAPSPSPSPSSSAGP